MTGPAPYGGVRGSAPTQVAWRTPTPPPPMPQRRSRRATAILVVAAIVVFAALGWRVSGEARDTWWVGEPHVPAPIDANGVATLEGISVRLVGVERIDGSVSVYGDPWRPPDGLVLWQVALAVESTNTEIYSLDVLVQDSRGRRFETGNDVPYGVDGAQDSLEVAQPEPGDDPLPEVQYLLVLMPADADPVAVRIDGGWSLDPDYFRLPVSE